MCDGGVEGDISSDIEERFIVLEKQKAVMDKLLRAVSDVPKVINIYIADHNTIHNPQPNHNMFREVTLISIPEYT